MRIVVRDILGAYRRRNVTGFEIGLCRAAVAIKVITVVSRAVGCLRKESHGPRLVHRLLLGGRVDCFACPIRFACLLVLSKDHAADRTEENQEQKFRVRHAFWCTVVSEIGRHRDWLERGVWSRREEEDRR